MNKSGKISRRHTLDPELWVEKHSDYLFAMAYRATGNRELSLDLVQDTFLAAFENKDRFLGKSAERTWLTSIIRRKIADYYRRNTSENKTEISLEPSFDTGGKWLKDRIPNPSSRMTEHEMENEELGIILDKCMDTIPDKYLRAFRMKTILDMQTGEICDELNISPSNFWVLIHRTRKKLQECLGSYGYN